MKYLYCFIVEEEIILKCITILSNLKFTWEFQSNELTYKSVDDNQA